MRVAIVPAFASLLLMTGSIAMEARAQAVVQYDAGAGTLPENQGWARFEQIEPPAPYVSGVSGGELHLSTLGFGTNVPADNGGAVWWQRDDANIDFTQDFTVELTVRIASAPDHAVNLETLWPRPGYTIAVYDVTGRIFWLGLGQNEVFLSNTAYGQYFSPNTVILAFNTTDAQHVYRIERAPGGVGAALRIDGVIRLQLPALGAPEAAGASLVYFGDPTFWANSDSYTQSVRFLPGVLDAPPPVVARQFVAAAISNPARQLGITFRSPEPGQLIVDFFDPLGRLVSRVEQDVSEGQSGHMMLPGEHRDGLYFYRVRLSPRNGRATEAVGRMVLLQ